MSSILTQDDFDRASKIVTESSLCWKTPLLRDAKCFFQSEENIASTKQLCLKLENMQYTGSFKVRGLSVQLANLPPDVRTGARSAITMSAGNYGKAFAICLNKIGLSGLVLMPETAPVNRAELIKSYGSSVERMPTSVLRDTVNKYVKERNMVYLHSFDDLNLIAGHSSLGFEILSELDQETPDIVLVCCGGGGLVAGVSSAIKSKLNSCRVYGVEPEGSRTMYESFKAGKPVTMEVGSVAAGLSPSFAGTHSYNICKQSCDGILLVTDQDIIKATSTLYRAGLVVEPSGAAAFAALQSGKVPDAVGKKVTAVLTGGNVSPDELVTLIG